MDFAGEAAGMPATREMRLHKRRETIKIGSVK